MKVKVSPGSAVLGWDDSNAVLDAAMVGDQDDGTSPTTGVGPYRHSSTMNASSTHGRTHGSHMTSKELGLATAWEGSMLPAAFMADFVLHLGLQGLAIATLVSVVDVEAALRAEASWVGDDDAARAAATRPSSVHETVVVAHVSTVDAFHTNGTTVPRNNHVWAWRTHDAVGAGSAMRGKITIRNGGGMILIAGAQNFFIFGPNAGHPIVFWKANHAIVFGLLTAATADRNSKPARLS